ncbi:hypothetical protein, partial [Burkholderia sp. Bp8986]|uniref:hypothetical protein n=1 Tax=Burkholderia sp. Bp8986 TaxID=2184550 RepID=UPI000FAD2B12
ECPAGRTYGTPEEIAKQTALLKQYGEVFQVSARNGQPDRFRILVECQNVKNKFDDLRTDTRARQAIAEQLSEDKDLTAGMSPEDQSAVFEFFINTPLAL